MPVPLRIRRVYRVTRAIHPLFDGAGAARFGARWNSPGRAVVYTTDSYAGALLEILVHAQRLDLREPYHCIAIDIPQGVEVESVTVAEIPDGWAAADYAASREVGDAWFDAARSACLHVPAVTGRPFEHNVIISPGHPDARRLRIEGPYRVPWDHRLTGLVAD